MSIEVELIDILGKIKDGVQINVSRTGGYSVKCGHWTRINSKLSLHDALTRTAIDVYNFHCGQRASAQAGHPNHFDEKVFNSLEALNQRHQFLGP